MWEAPLRSGRIPGSAVTRVRSKRFLSNVVVIEHTTGRPLLMLASQGLRQLLDELARLRPELDIRLAPPARL